MGGGLYSSSMRATRSLTKGYATKSTREIFSERSINNAMDPNGVGIRESRDSEEHPNSVPIVLALDVTGSMHHIPHQLVKDGLPAVMDAIISGGIPDPQVLFLGIGDHECDRAPLQVGQFESSDELLDHWLTTIFLEGGGGGNRGESYMLAWHFAANNTALDSLEKRNQKGFLFTIGDEPVLPELPKHAVAKIMGPGQHETLSSMELFSKASEKYNVYHLHMKQGSNGQNQDVMDGWKQMLGDKLILVDDAKAVPQIIADIVNLVTEFVAEPAKPDAPVDAVVTETAEPIEEML